MLDISIDTLSDLHNLSGRTQNVCRGNQINSLRAILDFHKNSKTFKNLQNAGKKTDIELQQICDYYTEPILINKNISDIFSSNELCSNSNTLLRKFDINTVEELISLSSVTSVYVLPLQLRSIVLKFLFQRQISFDKLSCRAHSVQVIDILINKSRNLSKGARNILKEIVKDVEKSPLAIYKYEELKNLLKIKNSGEKFSSEVSLIINDTTKILREYEYVEFKSNRNAPVEEILTTEKSNNLFKVYKLENALGWNSSTLKNWLFLHNISINDSLPIFSLFQVHINQKYSKKHLDIIYKTIGIKNKRNTVAKEIGLLYSLSRERIRQLKNKIFKEIIEDAKYVSDLFKEHNLKIKTHFEYFTEPYFSVSIDRDQECDIPEMLFIKLCSIFYDDLELVINNNKKLNFQYLIPTEIANCIDIRRMLLDFDKIFEDKIERSYVVSINKLIQDYKKKEVQFIDIDDVKIYITNILSRNYSISVEKDKVFIPRNTVKKVYEYIEDILTAKGEAMHIDDISTQYNELFNKKSNPSNIRSHCLGHPDIFINTSWSTYGLTVWEKDGKYIGGTIKQVIQKFLSKFEEPKHVYDIFKFISKHRDTSIISIWSNINLDPKEIFITFEGGFVGLNEKKYAPNTTIFNKVSNSWFFHFKKKFIVNNRSQLVLEQLCIKFAAELNVQPIQIENLIYDRINKGDLSLDNHGFVQLNLETSNSETTSLMEEQESEILINSQIRSLIRKKLLEGEHLKALEICMEYIEEKGYPVSIAKAKKIIDLELNKLSL